MPEIRVCNSTWPARVQVTTASPSLSSSPASQPHVGQPQQSRGAVFAAKNTRPDLALPLPLPFAVPIALAISTLYLRPSSTHPHAGMVGDVAINLSIAPIS